MGPGTIPRDRFDYSSAITESWKRQTLLNIVKLRYLDPPIFVDVGQIVAGYTIESGVNVAGAVSGDPAGAAGGSAASIGGAVRYTDRPTITYVPMTGNRFVRALMTPLPPEAVFSALSGGWPADGILGATVNSMNGIHNARSSLEGITAPDPRFMRVLQLMREIQDSGALGMRVRKEEPQGAASSLLVVRRRDITPETVAKGKELRGLLGLDPDAEEFTLVYGGASQGPAEVAVVTRSVLHILVAMSMGVAVPEEDIQEGRASPGLALGEKLGRLITVNCSDSAPGDADAYVVVEYRDRWFWIDDRDMRSKRAFAFMMMLFTMSDPAQADNAPVLTIPT